MLPLNAQCYVCRHLRKSPAMTCDAYPDGIPSEMFGDDIDTGTRMVDHRKPYQGDHGIRFEPLPGKRHPLEVLQEGKDARPTGET